MIGLETALSLAILNLVQPGYLTMQKIRLVKGGYQLASLCCRPEDEKKYSSVFNEISFIGTAA